MPDARLARTRDAYERQEPPHEAVERAFDRHTPGSMPCPYRGHLLYDFTHADSACPSGAFMLDYR